MGKVIGVIQTFHCTAGCEQPPFEQYASTDASIICPSCGARAESPEYSGKHAGMDWDRPVHSNALGVNPNQIEEAKRAFPHHEYDPEGRMILRNAQQKRRAMRDLGFMDKDGN